MTPVQRFRPLASILLFLVVLKPTLSLSLDPSEENQNKEFVGSSLKVSGYAQLLFTEQNDNQDTFAVRRARLNLGGNLAKKLKLKLQVDLTRSPALMDALVELALDEKINLRLGQFLVPFSLENTTSAAELLTINRSSTVELLAPGRDNRAAGASWFLANRSKLQANFEYRREKNAPDDRTLLIQFQVGF